MTEHEAILNQFYWIAGIGIPLCFAGLIGYKIYLTKQVRKKATLQLKKQNGKCYQCGIRLNESVDAIIYGNFKEDRHAYCTNCKTGEEIS